jgi:hypothetical protein
MLSALTTGAIRFYLRFTASRPRWLAPVQEQANGIKKQPAQRRRTIEFGFS